jgi:hypothetical protein
LEETCGSACRWPHRSTGGSVMPITLAGALLIIASSRSPRRGEGPQGAVIELAHRGTSARPPSLDGCNGGSLHREVIIRHRGNLTHLIMQIPCPLKYKSGCIPCTEYIFIPLYCTIGLSLRVFLTRFFQPNANLLLFKFVLLNCTSVMHSSGLIMAMHEIAGSSSI